MNLSVQIFASLVLSVVVGLVLGDGAIGPVKTWVAPVGTMFIGFASGTENFAARYFWALDRERNRRYAAFCALDVIRRHLCGLPQLAS